MAKKKLDSHPIIPYNVRVNKKLTTNKVEEKNQMTTTAVTNEVVELKEVHTIQELVTNAQWMDKIRAAVRVFQIDDDVEDRVQDVIQRMIEKQYIERWNPAEGSFSNWVYTFVNNLMRKRWRREHTVVGAALKVATRIDKPITNDEDSGTIGDFIPDLNEDSFEARDTLDEMEKMLKKFVGHSANVYNGKTYNRDMLTTLQLLRLGHDIKEISVMFNTSVQFVYTLVRKISEVTAELAAA